MLQVDVIETVIVIVTMIVIVAVIVVVTVGLHLYFRVAGKDKERGLYPSSSWWRRISELELPSGWSLRIKGL
jgi:hypothetical protein